jgi:hypothetical protein
MPDAMITQECEDGDRRVVPADAGPEAGRPTMSSPTT